jgi:hypothetical protein
MIRTTTMATVIGITRWAAVALAASRTVKASSVA